MFNITRRIAYRACVAIARVVLALGNKVLGATGAEIIPVWDCSEDEFDGGDRLGDGDEEPP